MPLKHIGHSPVVNSKLGSGFFDDTSCSVGNNRTINLFGIQARVALFEYILPEWDFTV